MSETTTIFITGFPHCGTTILRKLLGNSSCVVDVIPEVGFAPRVAMARARANGKSHVVYKKPIFSEALKKYVDQEYDQFNKRIIILRNPLQVFSSINRRFKNTRYPFGRTHTFDQYEHCCRQFDWYRKNNQENTLPVLYEDLFKGGLEKVFEFSGIPWSDEITKNSRTGYVFSSNMDVVRSNEHLMNRHTQINSTFEYRESPVTLTGRQEAYIRSSEPMRLIYDLDK
jgi:hypothetical protein